MGGVRAVLRREGAVTTLDEKAMMDARIRKLETEVASLNRAVARLIQEWKVQRDGPR